MPREQLTVVIIGNGPWGIAALDRCVALALENTDVTIKVIMVAPTEPGSWSQENADDPYLLLNTIAGQIDSFSTAHFGEGKYTGAYSFTDWCVRHEKVNIGGDVFASRRLYGRYLRFVYKILVQNCPKNLTICTVRDVVVNIQLKPTNGVEIHTTKSGTFHANHILICTGYGIRENYHQSNNTEVLSPYPAKQLTSQIHIDDTVGIQGIGLVAVDVVSMLTEGLGGRFVRSATGQLRYIASKNEPNIFVFSRSGHPFNCRPKSLLDTPEVHQPVFLSAEFVNDLANSSNKLVSLAADILPRLEAEMWIAYTNRTLLLRDGADAARSFLLSVSKIDHKKVDIHCSKFLDKDDRFSAQKILYPNTEHNAPSSDAFKTHFIQRLQFDVMESLKGEANSPYKHAIETLRTLRDNIRNVVGFGVLDDTSHRAFFGYLGPRISQLTVGPPVTRGEEWLALIEAGILNVQLGPDPELIWDENVNQWEARSRLFESQNVIVMSHVIRGHVTNNLENPSLNPLIVNLLDSQLLSFVERGDVKFLNLDERLHPKDRNGFSNRAISILGVPTEGATYYNHYIPSSGGRGLAFHQIQRCLDDALSDFKNQDSKPILSNT